MLNQTQNKTELVDLDCTNPTMKLSDANKFKLHLPNLKHTYKRKYCATSVVLMFFIFSFIGWSWEVFFHLITDGVFVNRGMLFGPWLPIYGFGGTLTLLMPRRISKNPFNAFLIIAVLSTVIEYITSWYFEYTRDVRWWDYSEYIMNLNGRVCLFGAVFFGIGGCVGIYYLGPVLDDMIKKIPKRLAVCICIVLLFFFAADLVYSKFNPNIGEGITDYPKNLAVSVDDSYYNHMSDNIFI